jgi:hypothetical protein
MLLIFTTPVLIIHLWQLKTAVFLHRCPIRAVLLKFMCDVITKIETTGMLETLLSTFRNDIYRKSLSPNIQVKISNFDLKFFLI